MAITHSFVSAKDDGADTSLLRPSDWNNDHTIGAGTILPAVTLGGAVTTNGQSFSTGASTFSLNSTKTGTTRQDNVILRLASNASGADATIQFTDATTYNAYISMKDGNLYLAPGGVLALTAAATTGILTTAAGLVLGGAVTCASQAINNAGQISSGTNNVSNGYIKLFNAVNNGESNIYGDATYALHIDSNSNARPIGIDGSDLFINPAATAGYIVTYGANTTHTGLVLGGNMTVTGYAFVGALDSDTGFKKSGTQVVGAQGAAVADATDAASVILRLNDLLGRLRTHGLIAT